MTTYPPPKALLHIPPSPNQRVRSAIAAIKLLLRKSQLEEAAVQLQQLQQLEPSNVEIALLQAELLTMAGDNDRACQLLKQILKQQPGLIPALTLSAKAHTSAQRHLDALAALTLAHELTPKDHAINRQLATTLTVLRRLTDAADILAPVTHKSGNPADLAELAATYDTAGNLEQCLATYDKVKLPHRIMAQIHVLKAGALMARNKRSEALACIHQAHEANPADPSLQLFLAKNLSAEYPAEQQISAISDILRNAETGKLDRQDQARLHFALGLCLERQHQYADAFAAIEKANNLAVPDRFDKEQQLEKVALGIAEYFTKARLSQLAPAGHVSQQPVFVSGMPRSGTTLVDQIIANHPDAGTLGELELIPHLKQSLVSLQSTDINRCAQSWLAAAPAAMITKARIIDKSISTVLHTGLALLMFPKARFVYLQRHPMDVYWSAYREMFGINAMNHTYSPPQLIRHIRLYNHLINLWQERFPDRIRIQRYEDLVANPIPQAQAIIAHVGLEWNDSCLEFHKSETAVRTASMAQVRQPVNTASIGRWRKYETELAPVATELADMIITYEKAGSA